MFEFPKQNIQLFLTRRCQLRCRYCPVLKGDADMSEATMRRAVDLLLTHPGPRVRLDFGGGEPLLRFGLLKRAVSYARERAREARKEISFYTVTNGLALTGPVAAELARLGVFIELSMDGLPGSHNRFKTPSKAHRGLDPYKATRRGLRALVEAGARHTVVMVASPGNCGSLACNLRHVVGLGAREVEINYAIGAPWPEDRLRVLLRQFRALVKENRRALMGGSLVLGNLRGRTEPALLNAELMVDADGSLHLMSEWMFETTPPSGKVVYKLGDLRRVRSLDGIYWNRFHSYYTLVNLYQGQPRVRRVMLDNIRVGERVRRCFEELREEYLAADAPRSRDNG